MHGLYMPSIAIANNSTTNMTIHARPANSMDKLEAALNVLVADGRKTEAGKAAEHDPVAAVPAETSE
jgi:hypothetical protein